MKDRQYNGKGKRTNNDMQNITQKTKNRATRTALKPEVNSGIPEWKEVPVPHVAPVVLLLLRNPGE